MLSTDRRERLGVRWRQLGMRVHDTRRALSRPIVVVWAARAELAVFVGAVGGWCALTVGVARLVRPDIVWPLSLGILSLSLCGWRLLATVAQHGLYALSREDRRRG